MIGAKTIAAAAVLAAALFAHGPTAQAQAQAQAPQTLTISSFGGNIDEALKKAAADFERRFNVAIRWVPGATTEHAARLIATKANPEFDVALLDSISYDGPQRAGVFAKFDPAIMTNLADLRPQARLAGDSAAGIGFILTGIFYQPKVFAERGWPEPTSYDDLFKPEYCNRVGILHPNVLHGSTLIVLLAGGDMDKAADGIAKLGKLKGCVRTLEPSSPKMEEKMQLGEYVLGIHGSIRVVALTRDGYPVRFVVPKEGTVAASTTCSAVKGGKEKLAQEFCNAMFTPAAQTILRDEALYVPASTKVDIPERLIKLGLPPADIVEKAVVIDPVKLVDRRRDWARRVERELAP